jgi:hypothetical protein
MPSGSPGVRGTSHRHPDRDERHRVEKERCVTLRCDNSKFHTRSLSSCHTYSSLVQGQQG